MLFKKTEKIIAKNLNILTNGSGIMQKPYKTKKMQNFVRTTYSVLFIPIFTYDKVL